MSTWTHARVGGRIDWTPELTTIQLETDPLSFIPGQFANLALDVGEKRVRRSYSIASAPGKTPEFYITKVIDGALSPHLHGLQAGDDVWLDTRCVGLFTLAELPADASELWLLATGTGLGPYISMLRSGVLFPRFERVVVVHGVRTHAELGYREELVSATQNPAFKYLPMVTREQPGAGVLGGRIPDLIDNGTVESTAGAELNAKHAHFLICGNPAMITDTMGVLERRGFRRHKRREPGHITTEKYW